jgi:hypothetical protein
VGLLLLDLMMMMMMMMMMRDLMVVMVLVLVVVGFGRRLLGVWLVVCMEGGGVVDDYAYGVFG